MATSVRVPVSSEVLRWAQVRSGKDVESRFPRWRSWLDGDSAPTLRQLEDVAKYTHVPFGTLLLDAPPSVALPIPDYRRNVAARGREPSPDLLAVVHQSQRRQDWFREYAIENGLDPHAVPRLGAHTSVPDAACVPCAPPRDLRGPRRPRHLHVDGRQRHPPTPRPPGVPRIHARRRPRPTDLRQHQRLARRSGLHVLPRARPPRPARRWTR